MTEVQYLGQSYVMDDINLQQLQSLDVPYVDKKLLAMTPAEAIYNMQMLQKLASERAATDKDRANLATLRQLVRDQAAQIKKLQAQVDALTQ